MNRYINKLSLALHRLANYFERLLLRPAILKCLTRRVRSRFVKRFILKGWAQKLPYSLIKDSLLSPRAYSKPDSRVLVIGYIPSGSDGWILQFLFQDISKYASKAKLVQARTIQELQLIYYSSEKAIIISMHHSFVPSLVSSGLPPEDIVTFYTHSRLGLDISALGGIRAVLPMNSSEATALALSNLAESKIRVFPAGFDTDLFSLREEPEISSRDIDIIFVCRYVNEENKHYHRRKNYQLIIPLAKELASRGLKVCILGKDWAGCGDQSLLESIMISSIPHSQYQEIYIRSKLLLCPSLQEGGPVSWLEGMACGCLTLSNPTGFPLELRSGQLGSYLMTLNATLDDWVQEIFSILDMHKSAEPVDMDARNQFLSAASFAELAKVLELIASEPDKFKGSLAWSIAAGLLANCLHG
jgi:glycosyltransferase involved in cell wall biosynthesis